MPLIEPITAYDAKRKRPDRRYSTPLAPEHMVYFARMGNSRIVKIGRTNNISKRSGGHVFESGMTPRYLAQLIVSSRAEANELENHIQRFARSRFPRDERRKEWYEMTDANVAETLFRIRETSPVEILEVRGDPGAPAEVDSVFVEANGEILQLTAGVRRATRARHNARR